MKVVPQTITWVSCLSFRDVLPAKNARWVSLSELCVLLCQPFRGLWQRSWLRSLFLDWWGFLLPDWNGWNDRGVGKLKKGPMTHFYVFHNDAEKGALILHPCCGENSEIFWPVVSGPLMNCPLFVSFLFPYVKLLPQAMGSIEWGSNSLQFWGILSPEWRDTYGFYFDFGFG